MASRTQMRLAQLTGSFGNAPEQISDTRPAQAGKADASALLMSSGSLLGPLSEMASAIKRIHGGGQFAKAGPGQFFVDINPDTDNTKDLGSSSRKFAELHLGTSINLKGFGITAILDEDDLASNSASALATQQSIKAYVDAQDHDDDLAIAGDTGTGSVDLDSQSLTITGLTGLTSAASGQAVTVTLDDTTVTAAQYGSGAVSDFTIPEFTVDAQGRITQASEKVIQDATVSAKGVASFATADFAVTSGAVTIKPAGVLTAQIADSQITNALMADDAIDSAEIADGAIDFAHMSANSIDSDQYVDGSIDTAHIAASQITIGLMADDAVGPAELVDTAVTPGAYGSATKVTQVTVDAQGRLTAAAASVNIAIPHSQVTDFEEAAEDFIGAALVAGEGLDYAYNDATGKMTFSGELATDSNKGVASFAAADFAVTSGAVALVDLTVAHMAPGSITLEAEGLAANDSDTQLPTSAAVKNYVDTQITAQDLDIGGDSGVGAVDLDSQVLVLSGTANEIVTSAANQVITIGLPDDVTIGRDLVVTRNLTVNGDQFKIDGETVVMDDTLMEMGTVAKSAPTGTTTKDLGLLLHRHDGTAARLQFMGWDESADKFIMRSSVTETNGIISNLGSAAALEVGALTAAASSVSTLGTSGLATLASAQVTGLLTLQGGLTAEQFSVADTSGNTIIGGTLGAGASTLASAVVTGEADLQGDVKLGNTDSDVVQVNAKVSTHIIPSAQNQKDLGSATAKFRTIYAGTSMVTANLYADTLAARLDANNQIIDNINIDSGAIDGATIATSNITVGGGKTLDVSAGTLTLANDQISGDKVEGGTIAGITIGALVATTADINGGTIDGSIIGGNSVAAGSFAAIVGTTISASGNVSFNSNVTLGSDNTDDVIFNAKISDGALLPRNDAGVDLGSNGLQFKDLYINGVANIDDLRADTADINGGTIDGSAINASVIGGTGAAAGSFTALNASGLSTLNGSMIFGSDANDTISMNGKIQGLNPMIFEGSAGANKLTLSVINPTGSDKTITLPNATGTVAVSATNASGIQMNAFGNLSIGITGAPQMVGPDTVVDGDKILMYDASASANKKIMMSQVRNYLAASGTQKNIYQASALAAEGILDVGAMSGIDADEWHDSLAPAQEVYCNGQLLSMGVSGGTEDEKQDWYKHSAKGQIKFVFALEADDVLQFVLRA